jgi:hypothetical protein
MIEDKKLPRWLWFDRAALAAGLALAATFVPLTDAASVTLKVEAAISPAAKAE